MKLHYISEIWTYNLNLNWPTRKTFISNCGCKTLCKLLVQFMFIYLFITSTLGLASGMAILDQTYSNGQDLAKQTSANNLIMQRITSWTPKEYYFHSTRKKWKNNILSKFKTLKARKRRDTADNQNELSSPGPTVSEINTWPHSCHITTPRLPNKPVIYECVPKMLNPVVDLAHSTPTVLVVEPTSNIETGNNQTPNTTNRNPRNVYGLSDVTTQFDVPDDVTELRMWFQGIVSIEGSAFYKLEELKVLNLQHNQISYLSVDAFQGLSKLRELDLSYNRIQSIPSLTFNDLNNLEVLVLQHNEISYVQNSMFCGLSSILTLDLSYNVINDVGPYALRHFRSASTISIELGHNELRIPKKEWLRRAPTSMKDDPLCEKPQKSENKIKTFSKQSGRSDISARDVSGVPEENGGTAQDALEAVATGIEDTSVEQSPVRILRATHNPWSCKCDSRFCLVQFLRTYKSIMTSEFDESDNEVFEMFRYNEINATSGALEPVKGDIDDNITKEDQRYFKWYFTLPCDVKGDFKGYDLGRLSASQQNKIEGTCCQLIESSKLSKKILRQDETFGEICKKEEDENDGQLTENHVTVIGIVIVFCTPILLTLCPDCNRTVVPSSGGGMVAGGKFGGGALSTNNNNNKFASGLFKEERKPFNNDRFCLVVQQVDNKKQGSFYVEEVV